MAEIIRIGFGENTGTTAADSSGNARNMTGVPGWTTGPSGHGTAMARSTAGTGAQITTVGDLTAWTLMMWVRVRSTGTWASIMENPFDGTAEMFLEVNGLTLDLYSRWVPTGGEISLQSTALTSNTWTHVAYTYNATTDVGRLVINGTTTVQATVANALFKGASYYVCGSPSQAGNMDVDDFRLFDVGMTDSEVAAVMNDNTESAGGSGATVAAVRAIASAAALPPVVTGSGLSATVTAVRAIATAAAVPPVVTGQGSATVVAVRAQATAVAEAPAVEGEAAVTGGGPASATATMLPPTVSATRSATVVGVPATATAAVLAPIAQAGGSVTVAATAATASAAAIPPVVSGIQSATVTAVSATATATMLTPAITTDGSATVQAVAAQAYATAYAPIIQAVRHATVLAAKAVATATARAPFVTGAGEVLRDVQFTGRVPTRTIRGRVGG